MHERAQQHDRRVLSDDEIRDVFSMLDLRTEERREELSFSALNTRHASDESPRQRDAGRMLVSLDVAYVGELA